MRRSPLFSMLLVLFGTVLSGANEPSATNRFVILRNGQVLEGRVIPLGDRYQVTLASGAEMRVPVRQVEFCADSMEQAFELKRSELSPNSVRARLELVEWALNHRLYEQAASELTTAMYLEPRNSKVATLERRLHAMTTPARRELAEKSAVARETEREQDQGDLTNRPRDSRFPVQPAAYDAPAPADRPPSNDRKSPPKRPPVSEPPPSGVRQALSTEDKSPVELDLSGKELDEFVQAIQPFILNRCATNNCHGSPGNSSFHLIRPPQGKTLVRGLTMRNLQATLEQIDRTEPHASPLLTVPRAAHGNANAAIYSPTTESAVKRLTAWIERIANPPGLRPLDAQPIALEPLAPRAAPGNPPSNAADTLTSEPSPDDRETSDAQGRKPRVKNPSSAKRPDESTFVPRDPFDPEAFNRKYHGDKANQSPSP